MAVHVLWALLGRASLQGAATEMTIWVALLGCCFLVPIFLALRLSGSAHASIVGYVLSLTIGLAIGTGAAAMMSKMHDRIMSRSGPLQNVILLGAFAVELIWVALTGIIGWSAVTLLLRHTP